MSVQDYVVESLHNGSLRFAAEQPDNPQNFPRNMFIWRSNLLGSSGKGHEYMLKYLLGTKMAYWVMKRYKLALNPTKLTLLKMPQRVKLIW